MSSRFLCKECDQINEEEAILIAPNPFFPNPLVEDDTICGCPDCFEVNSLVRACDTPECGHRATCGTPTKTGYVWSCYEHIPKEEEE